MNTQLTRWNPFREMDEIQHRMASLFDWERENMRGNRDQEEKLILADWSPRVDIVEDEGGYVIKAELPEMKKEDVKVTVEDGILTVAGERKLEKEEKNRKFHRIEREYGSFIRSFALPPGTSGEKVAAEFKEGVLKIRLPKDTKAPGKAVEIKIG